MNLDSRSVGTGTTSSASTSSSRGLLPNGGCSDKSSFLNSDILFPPGGYPSLRLPVVVVLKPLYILINRRWLDVLISSSTSSWHMITCTATYDQVQNWLHFLSCRLQVKMWTLLLDVDVYMHMLMITILTLYQPIGKYDHCIEY